MKLSAYRANYFKDPWNVFDFIIIVVAIIPAGLLPFPIQILRIFRVLRALRTLRLFSAFRQVRIILESLIKALPGVLWTALILLVVYYVYGIIGTVLFADVLPDHFHSLGASVYTLFQVMTMESWSECVSRPVMEQCPWAWIYFVSFVIIAGFIMINVVMGIIVASIDETQRALAENAESRRAGDVFLSKIHLEEKSNFEHSSLNPIIPGQPAKRILEYQEKYDRDLEGLKSDLSSMRQQLARMESLLEEKKARPSEREI